MCVSAGINAYFAYTVVGFRGTGLIGYEQALAAVFIEVCVCICKSPCAVFMRHFCFKLLHTIRQVAYTAGVQDKRVYVSDMFMYAHCASQQHRFSPHLGGCQFVSLAHSAVLLCCESHSAVLLCCVPQSAVLLCCVPHSAVLLYCVSHS